jgi:hypothetical protein
MEYSTDALEKSAVQRLCDSIVLGGIVGGETTLCALGFEEVGKLFAGVFSTAVGPKALDACFVLSFCPGRKRFVGFEGFVLAA